MKQTLCKDLDVFDFKEDDELPDNCAQWSQFSNPKFEDPPITKYEFLQYASAASEAQMRGVHAVEHVHVVALDDHHHGLVSDVTPDSLDLLGNAGSKQSEGYGVVSGRPFEQRCNFSKDGINPKNFSLETEMKNSSHFRSSPINGLISPSCPESPSSNGSVDTDTSDGHDSVRESSLSAPASPVDENNVPRDAQFGDQSVSGVEMEEMNVVLHTDYVNYCDKFFPASVLLISKNSVTMKASVVEEESAAFKLEWDIDDIVSIESHWSNVANIAKVKFSVMTKNATQAEKSQDASGVKVLEFLVYDSDWLQRQDWIMSLNQGYKAAWRYGPNGKSSDVGTVETGGCSSDPYIPNFEEPFEEVVYPKGDVDAVSISKRDVDLLWPEIFINDTIIDFYTKYLKNEFPPQERCRFHFFNSFFFRKLADLDKNSTSSFDSKAAFQRVRKWTRKVNIFEKDYIFIPVNYNLHWSLIVICHPGEVANFSDDENMDESSKVPCILHMDSIRGSHMGLKDIIQSYLLEEWKERQKETSEDIHSKFLNLRFLSLELPQQENCSDCGLFLLHYAELFIAEAPVRFNPFMINKFEKFLKPDWFMPAEASLKRVHIQRLIYDLLESHSQACASPSTSPELYPSASPLNIENDNGIEIISEKKSTAKSWNGNISYPQSVQGLEMDVLDVSLYRNSQCINDSGVGLRELLEQGQHYDQGSSFGQDEAEVDGRLDRPSVGRTGLQTIDVMTSGACHISYSSGAFGEGFGWNSELSDQAEPEENSSPVSNCSSEEIQVLECEQERNGATASSAVDEHLEQLKEKVDNLTESYASASSDIMDTPADEFQVLEKLPGSNDQEDPQSANPENVIQPTPGVHKSENGVDMMVADDSSSDSDEEHTAKRIKLTPLTDEERELAPNLPKEV